MNRFLIVGLGNIGAEYEDTRHNIGFKVLESFAQKHNGAFATQRLATVCKTTFKGKQIVLVKPTTYMNLSGKAVKYWLQAEKINEENLMVITDDIALPYGTLRIKPKGSAGGHNGLKNIEQELGHGNYIRLRFGVGAQFDKGRQIDYVLGKWSNEENALMPERLEKCNALLESFIQAGLQLTMTQFNGK
jgi:peptidyl-tRNA hydrolase, PTH1 family